jgi:hypothetical protein
MARYPELPKLIGAYRDRMTPEAMELYRILESWSAQLVRELDLRDIEVAASPPTNIRTVVSITEIGRPTGGDIAYAAKTGKFKGYVSVAGGTITWEDLN